MRAVFQHPCGNKVRQGVPYGRIVPCGSNVQWDSYAKWERVPFGTSVPCGGRRLFYTSSSPWGSGVLSFFLCRSSVPSGRAVFPVVSSV
jgi:hypothetical protein